GGGDFAKSRRVLCRLAPRTSAWTVEDSSRCRLDVRQSVRKFADVSDTGIRCQLSIHDDKPSRSSNGAHTDLSGLASHDARLTFPKPPSRAPASCGTLHLARP